MATRRELLRALAPLTLLPLLEARLGAAPLRRAPGGEALDSQRGRGIACALGEEADAADLPAPRRAGEHLALALSGTTPVADADRARVLGSAHCQWIEISLEDRGTVDDGPLAERIRTAASVTLVEAGVLDWLIALYPARRSSAVLHALVECAATGGRVIGRGSAAFLVAGGGVVLGATRDAVGESRLRQANPRKLGGVRLAHGLGLSGGMVLDTHGRARGDLLRLISVLVEWHCDEGVMLFPRSALCCDLELRRWRALGPDPLIALELRGSRRGLRTLERARLSVLAAGDGWSWLDRRLSSAGEPVEFGPAAAAVSLPEGLDCRRFLVAPARSRAWTHERASVEVSQVAASRAFAGPDGAAARGHGLDLCVELSRGSWGLPAD